MSKTKLQTKTENNPQQPNALKNKPTFNNVRQDKRELKCARTASRQPVTVENPMRARRLNNSKPRSKKRNVNKNGLVPIDIYCDPIVMEKLQQFALEQGISVNKAGAAILEVSLKENIIQDHIELIKPLIESIIAKKMQKVYEIVYALEYWFYTQKPIRRKN